MLESSLVFQEKRSDEDKSSLNDQEKERGSEHEKPFSELDDPDDPNDQEESGLPVE